MADSPIELVETRGGIRYLPEDANSFEIDGTVYAATEDLCPMRYKAFQKFSVEMGFNGTFNTICKVHDEVWDHFNKAQNATGIQKLGNLRDGLSYAGSGRIGGIELCALFFNSGSENPAEYDHAKMVAKMRVFESSNINVGFFFQQAARRVTGFAQRFLKLSPPETPTPEPTPEA